MKLHGATALVTGSNRGIGLHFAEELLRRGAKVYATARRPESVSVPGAEVIRLDITTHRRSTQSRHWPPTWTCWSTTPQTPRVATS
jgi:NAD(P)-dependent dehydrogenase (short-subunit alcohol dehydrogenase family)